MLDMSRTRLDMDHTREVPLLSTIRINQEGLMMQLVLENGMEKCRPSTGTDAAMFLGVSWGEPFAAPTSVARTEVVTTNGAGSVMLSKAPTGYADMSVFVGSDYTGTRVAGAATAGAGVFAIAPDGRTLLTDRANTTLFVVYRYEPTLGESAALFGELRQGYGSINALSKTGLVTRGWIYTDQFDPTIAWGTLVNDALVTPAMTLRGGANGRITAGATGGCDISKFAHVIEAPSAASPWLGLYFRGA